MFPVLAIDYGDARIGLAMTDPMGILAYPLETIHLKSVEPIERISYLVGFHQVKTIVLGLPLRLDGSEGTAAEKIYKFKAQLEERLPEFPIQLVDERLTTTAAAEKLHAAGKRSKKQRSVIDQAAAVEILNTWLEERGLAN